MGRVDVERGLDAGLVDTVTRLAERAEVVDGYRFLSDHLWIELRSSSSSSGAALLRGDDGELVAYAQASPANAGWIIEATVAPGARDDEHELLVAVLHALITEVGGDAGGGPRSGDVVWWTHDTTLTHEAVATELGLRPWRKLHKMHVALPLGRRATIATRPFVVDRDEPAVLAVNNRAFGSHGEQGGWTPETLRSRQLEPWFDPVGFRLHERDGRLAGFCWTKLHATGARRIGEIYVVAADPDFQELGLGSELTLAGLESIGERGVAEAMLFVDEENDGAIAMYERLGFRTVRLDKAFTRRSDEPA